MKYLHAPIYLLLLVSCTTNPTYAEENISSDLEYPNDFILWENLFAKGLEKYYVYVFDYDCYYCNQTKNKIICFYEHSSYPVYFCEYSKIIPIGQNTDKTIDAIDVKDVFIKGTPSLLFISNGKVAFNIAGKAEVSEMIDLQLKNE